MAFKSTTQKYAHGGLFRYYINDEVKTEILKALPVSMRIWNNVISEIQNVEKNAVMPFWLNESKKPYAIDAILITKAFGFYINKNTCIFELFTLYYLEVHLIDDLVEDQQKFYSKFLASPALNLEQFKAATSTFTLSFNTAAMNIMQKNSMTDTAKYEIMRLMTNSLLHQVVYFTKEKCKQSPEEVLEIKERQVSGKATSFMAELLNIQFTIDSQKLSAIKNALFYLGSLTQFTDDLRDLKKDESTGNANLIVSLKDKFGSNAMREFNKLYDTEEALMLSEISTSGIAANTALLRAIPWHPFLIKGILK